jgi:4'-phosphopantetheinyl transferase
MPLAHSQVDVWLARAARLDDPALLEGFSRILPDEDRERVERMRFREGRHEQLITRTLARRVLSHYLPEVPPADWRFDRTELGRPAVARSLPAAARQLHFNIAHTRGLVVMAVGRQPDIGVDVECITDRVPLEVAQRYFSTAEIAALDALPEADKPRRFQRLWTLKESYLKAVGTGISGGLASMTFHFEPEVRFEHAGDAEAARWQFREFTIDAEYLLALAWLDRESDAALQVTLRDFSGQE